MKDLADTILSKRILSKFELLLRFSQQAAFLSSRGPFTVFAPTDSAFSRMSPQVFAALQRPENHDLLLRIVLFHIVNGQRLTVKDMAPLKTVLSCEGNPLPLRVNHTGYEVVSKAKVIHADIRCLNGLLHEVDTVLLPPGLLLSAVVLTPPPAPQPAANSEGTPTADSSNDTAVPPTPSLAPTNSDAPTNAAPVPSP